MTSIIKECLIEVAKFFSVQLIVLPLLLMICYFVVKNMGCL